MVRATRGGPCGLPQTWMAVIQIPCYRSDWGAGRDDRGRWSKRNDDHNAAQRRQTPRKTAGDHVPVAERRKYGNH